MGRNKEITVTERENGYTVEFSRYTESTRTWVFAVIATTGVAVSMLLEDKDPVTGEPLA